MLVQTWQCNSRVSAAKIAVAPSSCVISSGVLQGEEVKFDSSMTGLFLLGPIAIWRITTCLSTFSYVCMYGCMSMPMWCLCYVCKVCNIELIASIFSKIMIYIYMACMVLHCIVLYRIVLYCIVLYGIVYSRYCVYVYTYVFVCL